MNSGFTPEATQEPKTEIEKQGGKPQNIMYVVNRTGAPTGEFQCRIVWGIVASRVGVPAVYRHRYQYS